MTDYRPISEAPRDGSWINVRAVRTYRFKLYSPKSPQFKKGQKGRWQAITEYGGWENCEEPVGDWVPNEPIGGAA